MNWEGDQKIRWSEGEKQTNSAHLMDLPSDALLVTILPGHTSQPGKWWERSKHTNEMDVIQAKTPFQVSYISDFIRIQVCCLSPYGSLPSYICFSVPMQVLSLLLYPLLRLPIYPTFRSSMHSNNLQTLINCAYVARLLQKVASPMAPVDCTKTGQARKQNIFIDVSVVNRTPELLFN